MSARAGAIKQNDAKRIFKAAKQAGFENAKITIHPDGRIEASVSVSEPSNWVKSDNTWDDVLK